jgi:hypothetical protein
MMLAMSLMFGLVWLGEDGVGPGEAVVGVVELVDIGISTDVKVGSSPCACADV